MGTEGTQREPALQIQVTEECNTEILKTTKHCRMKSKKV